MNEQLYEKALNAIILILIVGVLALIIKLFLAKEAEGQTKSFLQDTAWITTTIPKDSLVLNFMIVGTKLYIEVKSDSVGWVVPSYEFYDYNVYEINWSEIFQTVGAICGIASFLGWVYFGRILVVLRGKKD